MTREELKRLATKRPDKIESLKRVGEKDTYKVEKIFSDTSFLTDPSRQEELKAD
jgi:hypothetical protein